MTRDETNELVVQMGKAIKQELTPQYYETVEELPYGQDIIQAYIDRGILKGTGRGLHLSEDLLRTLIILDRMGI